MAKIKINKSNVVINKSARYKELVKCGDDPKYFIKKYIKISHPTKGLIKFELFPFQEECLDAFVNHKKIIINKSRQLGLSTLAAAYSLWMALFHRERNVLVIATKLDVAKNFIRKVNANLEGLPDWLVLPKKTAQSVKYIQFSNGSQIKAIPTSAASVRSEAVSILICDEAAHVDGIDELWLGLQPTLSCVAGDTLILTDNGFIRIEDFHKNKNIGDYFDLEIPVYGKHGLELTSKGYVSPESETLIVRTKHGHKLEVTPKHPLYTLQDDGLGKMVQAQHLKLGDYLRIEVGQNNFGKTHLHPDMAYMLGGYIAEGWVAKRKNKKTGVIEYDSVEVENQDDGFRDVFLKSKSLKKNFTIVPSRKTRLRCSSRELIKELKILGVNPDLYCHNKVTPKSILQGDRETVTNYLSGLFDGDGNVSERHISLSSTSEKLIRETSLLLHNLGFVSNIHHVPARLKDIGRIMPQGRPLQSLRDSWVVSVAKSQYKKFYEEIGFRIKRKNDNLLKLSQSYIQDNAKLQKIPIIKIKNKFQYFINKSGYTKNWFYEQGIRFDRKSNGKINQNVTKSFLLKLKTILTEKAGLILTEEEQLFFNENIGSFYWDEIVSFEKSHNKTYDFTVPKTHSFLQNGILGSNTGGSAILISSPAGVGNLFHRLWIDAKESPNNRKEGKNGFYPIELPWTVHPERDQEWFNAQRAEIITATGERGVGMELLCNFASSGDTFLKGDAMDDLMNSVRPPINIQAHGRDEVWVWETPKVANKYIISADVSRGDADDFSAFCIIDTNENEVVADFKGKLPPDRFADLLITYGKIYNEALICQELNAIGAACAIQLKSSKYPNLFYEKFQKNIYMSYMSKDVEDEFPGYTMSSNTRAELLAKLEATIRNKKIKLYSKRLFEEMQTFIWKNNKAQSQKGYNDDLVLCLAIGCGLYEPDGKNNGLGNLSEALALLKGMSRESKTINPYSGDQQIHKNQSTTTADGMWKKKNNADGTHNYRSEQYNLFKWVFRD